MDDVFELPAIRPDDYRAFRDIPTRDLPNTYDEWLQLVAKRRLERGQAGFVVVDIQIEPHEFARYLSRMRHDGNLKSLADFCKEKRLANNF